MSANPNSTRMNTTEYLEFEHQSEGRHEFIDGEVFAMAGASPRHNLIMMALSYLIFGHLIERDCNAYGENQRLKVEKPKGEDYLYPDMSVVCGDPIYADDTPQSLINPQLIIEVLSPSTAKFDLDEKFALYRQLDTFREYVLIWQDKPKVARYYLNDNGIWEFADVNGLDASIIIRSIGFTLSLADVYQSVTFEDEDNNS